MKLNSPKNVTFYIAVLLGLLGLLGGYAFWLAFVGLVLLALGNLLSGL